MQSKTLNKILAILEKPQDLNMQSHNSMRAGDAYMRQQTKRTLVPKMVCSVLGSKPLSGTNAGLLLTETSGIHCSEICVKIQPFSSAKMMLTVLSAKWQPFILGLEMSTLPVLSDNQFWLVGSRMSRPSPRRPTGLHPLGSTRWECLPL